MEQLKYLNQIHFEFDERLKDGYFSSDYFLKTKKIIESTANNQIVTLQFMHFSKTPIMVCGIEEVKQLLEFCLTKEMLEEIEVNAVLDGTILEDSTFPILIITGKYSYFGYLENVIDGILARRSSVSTNCMNAISKLDKNQRIIFMADRTDDYHNQAGDGYAAYVAGIDLFVTQAHSQYIKNFPNVKVIGTMPHALIQQYKGDLRLAIENYFNVYQIKTTALIDYHNDVIKELESIYPVMDKVAAVRIDTSKYLIDRSLMLNKIKEHGINANLIKLVRNWLDEHNLQNIKLIVSSGITPSKIEHLNLQNVKVDFYGIGSNFLTPTVMVSGDLVMLNNEPEAKVGRHLLDDRNTFKKII